MFVIESYFKTRKAKIEAYENACTRWREKQSSYSTRRDYEMSHAYPVIRWEKVAPVICGTLIGLFVVTLFILMIMDGPKK